MLADSKNNSERALGLQTENVGASEEGERVAWGSLVKIQCEQRDEPKLADGEKNIGNKAEGTGEHTLSAKEISMEEFAKCADELCTELEDYKRLAALKKILRRK